MRLDKPRIAPLGDDELDAEQRAALQPFFDTGRPVLNIFRTLARAPKALTRFNDWGGYILSRRNSLTPREREIVILRVGWLCRSGYEFTQHTRIGLDSGLSANEIEKIKAGAEAGWSEKEAALLRMADDLIKDHFVSEPVWAALKAHFDEKQRMDAVFTAGQYAQVSMFLNTFGVQLEAGQTVAPDLEA